MGQILQDLRSDTQHQSQGKILESTFDHGNGQRSNSDDSSSSNVISHSQDNPLAATTIRTYSCPLPRSHELWWAYSVHRQRWARIIFKPIRRHQRKVSILDKYSSTRGDDALLSFRPGSCHPSGHFISSSKTSVGISVFALIVTAA